MAQAYEPDITLTGHFDEVLGVNGLRGLSEDEP